MNQLKDNLKFKDGTLNPPLYPRGNVKTSNLLFFTIACFGYIHRVSTNLV